MKIVHAAGSAPTLRPQSARQSGFSGLGRCTAAGAVMLVVGLAAAQSVVFDQFMQPGAQVSGTDGGRSFSGPWLSSFQTLDQASDGLTYLDPVSGTALATAGGRIANSTGAGALQSNFRYFDFNTFPAGSPWWGSFLVRLPQGSESIGSASLVLGGSGEPFSFSIGVMDNQIAVATPWGSYWPGLIDAESTVLMLFRVDSAVGGGGPVSIWVNPPLAGELPAPTTVIPSMDFGQYGPTFVGLEAAGNEYSLDEIRFGMTAATVLPRNRVAWTCASGGSGHLYETVHSVEPISWNQAAAAAMLRGGRLVTLTSPQENQLVFENLVAREDVWDQRVGDLFFEDVRGPWIGAIRPTYFPDPMSGWEWSGGEPWGFESWSPEGLVGIGDLYASYYMGTNQATPTWRNANFEGDSRVFGYVVEYESGIVQQPQDVALTAGTAAQFSVSVAGDPASMSFQWFRDGVPLADEPTPHGSWIVGATSPTLQIESPKLEDCGAYWVQVVSDCGQVQSSPARLKVDAINGSYVDPDNCWIIRIVTAPAPIDLVTARSEAWSKGGELLSINNARKQTIVDAIAAETQLWQTNSLDQQVGPWVGASYNATMREWYWRNGWGFTDSGYTNWAPGQPDNADSWEEYVFLTREDASGVTQWADLAGYNPVGGTLPNSYIMEWDSPFRSSYGFQSAACGANVTFDGSLGDHGLLGTFEWLGPDYLPVVDGVSPNGTQISGQGTPILQLSGVTQADAGAYTLYFNAGCNWSANYTLNVIDCAPACPADFNQDGGVDGADVDAFFAAWESGDASADVNQDGGVDGSDIDPFFFAWENGGC